VDRTGQYRGNQRLARDHRLTVPCDNFLYGFKGGLATAAAVRRAVAEVPGVARECQRWRGSVERHGDNTESGGLGPGEAVAGGGLGFARRLPRGSALASAARRPVCRPEQARTGNLPLRPRELAAREQPAVTTTRATRASAPSHRQGQIWHLRGSERSALPEPPAAMVDVSRNPSRALRVAPRWAAPTLDRTRPTCARRISQCGQAQFPRCILSSAPLVVTKREDSHE
jgi:hypothetical protein